MADVDIVLLSHVFVFLCLTIIILFKIFGAQCMRQMYRYNEQIVYQIIILLTKIRVLFS